MKPRMGITDLRRTVGVLSVVSFLVLTSTLSVFASPDENFPDMIALPDGFRPEGIAVGRGHSFYAGSLGDGSVFGGDLRTGQGTIVVPPQDGRIAVGLSVDLRTNYLFVAGGSGGAGYVYDIETGEDVATYEFTTEAAFINDVVVTRDAAYFTDSFRPFLYRVPLGPGGTPGEESAVESVPLGGDFVFVPGAFNANGIDATSDGKMLMIVHSGRGELYSVDPVSGNAALIDLGGAGVPNGDGILLDGGKTLYVMQNRLNQIAVIKLDPKLSTGTVVDTITDADFDVPTTIAEFGNDLYAVNARFGTPPAPETEYDVVRVPKR